MVSKAAPKKLFSFDGEGEYPARELSEKFGIPLGMVYFYRKSRVIKGHNVELVKALRLKVTMDGKEYYFKNRHEASRKLGYDATTLDWYREGKSKRNALKVELVYVDPVAWVDYEE